MPRTSVCRGRIDGPQALEPSAAETSGIPQPWCGMARRGPSSARRRVWSCTAEPTAAWDCCFGAAAERGTHDDRGQQRYRFEAQAGATGTAAWLKFTAGAWCFRTDASALAASPAAAIGEPRRAAPRRGVSTEGGGPASVPRSSETAEKVAGACEFGPAGRIRVQFAVVIGQTVQTPFAGYLNPEPFAAAAGDLDGVQFAALDLVQNGLAGAAELLGGLALAAGSRQGTSGTNRARTSLSEPDPPRSVRGRLLDLAAGRPGASGRSWCRWTRTRRRPARSMNRSLPGSGGGAAGDLVLVSGVA